MTKRAFLLGFSYPNDGREQVTELRGACRSAIEMRKLLVEYYGFKIEDIILRLDLSPIPGSDNSSNFVLRLMLEFVKSSQEGDTLLIFMAGHGAQKSELIKKDGKSYLIETNHFLASGSTLISEFDFIEVVRRVPNGVGLTFITDFSYSGGIFKGLFKQFEGSEHVVYPCMDDQDPLSPLKQFIFLYSAPQSETSLVRRTKEGEITLFMHTLINILKETNGYVTNSNLIDQLRKILHLEMSPGLCCSDQLRDVLFLGGPIKIKEKGETDHETSSSQKS